MRAIGNYTDALVLNLDQMGVFFENPHNMTLSHQGASQVPILSDKFSVWATVVLTIAMNGEKLPPYVIFKGVRGPTSRIAQTFSGLPIGAIYAVQPNAWIDTDEMLRYIDTILAPYAARQLGRRCLIMLDSFSVHLNDRIQQKLQDVGYDPLYIPKGLTGLLQPLDICVNKPFKDLLKDYYTQWLISSIDFNDPQIRRPKLSRFLLAQWVQRGWGNVSSNIVKNAFDIFKAHNQPRLKNEALICLC
jgi:hypothetical protein